ncbi:unnamed protein product [Prorocentrum cordatum]|uniref:Apple domain-containing protein n=1 Tax=Prorocentrum cordatum TaxID=2364126 RepID=A0ABN9PKN6_9DINO|nr:unnamed protein product [Polarella glacialis]
MADYSAVAGLRLAADAGAPGASSTEALTQAPAGRGRLPRRACVVAVCCAAAGVARWCAAGGGLSAWARPRGLTEEEGANRLDQRHRSLHPNVTEDVAGMGATGTINDRVAEILTHDWSPVKGKNCWRVGFGSGHFPDGSTSEDHGNNCTLDVCLKACMESDFCHGITVEAGKNTSGPCWLLPELVLDECQDGPSYDTYRRGPIPDRVAQIQEVSGWRRYEGLNCYPGAGSWNFPGITGTHFQTYAGRKITVNECMMRCEQDPLCEAIVVAHQDRAAFTPCKLRHLVVPGLCSKNMAFDTWMMDQGRTLAPGVEEPAAAIGRDRLHGVLDMVQGEGFDKIDLSRCALVGASGVMKGSHKGAEIDGHTAVIRINRLPRGEYYADFGAKTDFFYVNHELSGQVSLMGGENAKVIKCADAVGCPKAGIIARGDLERCKPSEMASKWGPDHPLVGCTHTNISRMVATGFHTLHGALATTGLHAFFTFLPVCDELNLYGFGGLSTADGHAEWTQGHNLFQEHLIQDHVISRQWDSVPWRNKFREFDWMKRVMGKVRKVVGTVA